MAAIVANKLPNLPLGNKPDRPKFGQGGHQQKLTSLRQALCMPALVAIRFNADMKAKYQALIAAGKPPKVAITTVMRKLTILANVLLRQQRNWTPKMA